MNVLITGATGGIGREIALCLSQSATLYITGRNERKLGELKELILSKGGGVHSFCADISYPSARDKLLDTLVSDVGSLDWIVHAAGAIDPQESKGTLNAGAISRIFEINTFAPILLTRGLSPLLTDCGGTLFIASTAGIWGNASFPIYSASKAALINFSKSLAKKLTSSRQLSIALCPGPTDTEMREHIAGDASQQQSPGVIGVVVRKIVLGESSYKNGDVLIVRDGHESLYQEA